MTSDSYPAVLPLFGDVGADDQAIAVEVQKRLGFVIPLECVAGVALNARVLQAHYDALVGAQCD